ncbi:hypothetical protein OESDEN_05888 [Oesophagostomum dentatum]|uniref:Uncharacterized protein n=1 Tax=Oesophagostomum dentatum TaxID=61180 RepID=A0A0B1TDM0_OESDE|nr:hypothetical protein OESDEN_05888 [Oesophagostomum dentatum]
MFVVRYDDALAQKAGHNASPCMGSSGSRDYGENYYRLPQSGLTEHEILMRAVPSWWSSSRFIGMPTDITYRSSLGTQLSCFTQVELRCARTLHVNLIWLEVVPRYSVIEEP